MKWTMNSSSLEKGMLIRRPGLDEALEVLNVRNNQAKIKLPDGKTSTIPASAEVEWSWPDTKTANKEAPVAEPDPYDPYGTVDAEHEEDAPEDDDWQTDWSLLGVGAKIRVLGEKGDFMILRLTDSSARIKHEATGQIQPLSIGHKFKIVESVAKTKTIVNTGRKANGKTKGKATTKPTQEPLDLEPEPDNEPELEIGFKPDKNREPSDEVLTALENGDEIEDENLGESPFDAEDEDETEEIDDQDEDEGDFDLDNDQDEDDDFEDQDLDQDDNEKEITMPAPKNSTTTTTATTSRKPTASSALLTLGQISERTGISYPTLVRYVRDHSDRLPSEGEGRSRRYYPDAIEVFREIRSESRTGRKPKEGSERKAGKAQKVKVTKRALTGSSEFDGGESKTGSEIKTKSAKTPSKSVPAAIWAPANAPTIDSALSQAIDHANAQIAGLQALIENLTTQREQLKLWS